MVKKGAVAAALVVGLLVFSAVPAFAWTLIADKTHFGTTTLKTWTHGYSQVAFFSRHAGTHVSVRVTVNCRGNNNDYSNSWQDGGAKFRAVVRGLLPAGRCYETFREVPRNPGHQLYLATFARG